MSTTMLRKHKSNHVVIDYLVICKCAYIYFQMHFCIIIIIVIIIIIIIIDT